MQKFSSYAKESVWFEEIKPRNCGSEKFLTLYIYIFALHTINVCTYTIVVFEKCKKVLRRSTILNKF